MENTEALKKFIQVSQSLTKTDLAFAFPRDFEVYMMAIELTDSNDNLIDYFAFPIMPDSISKTENQIINTKKTMQGVSVLTTKTNPIQSISIKGDFGSKFKVLLNPKQPSSEGYAYSIDSGMYDQYTSTNTIKNNNLTFLDGIKTGYGAITVFKSIISKSNGVDKSGNPFRLYLYNMALGEAYLVTTKPEGLTVSQDKERNMIWRYNITFDILSPLALVRASNEGSSSSKAMMFASVQKNINKTVKELNKILFQ